MAEIETSDNKRIFERGNIFFTLFGAVALVGVLGAGIMATMRGPLTTMVEVNHRTKAESEMSIASKLVLLEAVQDPVTGGDCDNDGFIEPLPYADPGADDAPQYGGFLPTGVGSEKIDPWGTRYGYCAWDSGPVVDDAACGGSGQFREPGTGDSDETYTVIAVISAGPDQQFDTSCPGGASPEVTKAPGSDDIVASFTYQTAAAATDGLWKIKSGNPDVAEINKDIEAQGAAFTGNVNLTDPSAQLQLGAASMILPTQVELATCSSANNMLVRVNTATNPISMEICNGATDTWVNVAEGASNVGVWQSDGPGGPAEIYYNGGNVGIGTNDPDDALDVVGSIELTENLKLKNTKSVIWESGAAVMEASGGLEINANGGTGVEISVDANDIDIIGDTTVTGSSTLGTDTGFEVLDSGAGPLLTVLNDGNVGIGTSNPDDALSVVGGIDTDAYYKIDDMIMLNGAASVPGTILLGNMAAVSLTGDNNTILGANAGSTITTGTDNILVGEGVDAPGAATTDYLNIGDVIHGDIANKRVGIGFADTYNVSGFDDALEVNGAIHATDDVKADGDVIGEDVYAVDEIYVDGDLLGPPLECTLSEKLEWQDGAGWSCVTDQQGGSGGGAPDLFDVLTQGNDAGGLDAVDFGAIGIGTGTPTGLLDVAAGTSWVRVGTGFGDVPVNTWVGDTGMVLGVRGTGGHQIAISNISGAYGIYMNAAKVLDPDAVSLIMGGISRNGGSTGLAMYSGLDLAFHPGDSTFADPPSVIMKDDGSVGIGDSTPDDGSGSGGQDLRLDVAGAVGAPWYCDDAGLNCFQPGDVGTAGNLDLEGVLTNGNDANGLDAVNLGSVGIGTATPSSVLDVVNAGGATPDAYVLRVRQTSTTGAGTDSNALINFSHNNAGNSRDWYVGTGDGTHFGHPDNFGIRDGATTKVLIGTGSIGLNTGNNVVSGANKVVHVGGGLEIGTAIYTSSVPANGLYVEGKVGIGDRDPDDGTAGGGEDLVLDLEGSIGAEYYCDMNGENCFDFTDITTAGAPKLNAIIAADANNTIANAAWNQNWNWQLTAAETGFNYGETAASTGGSNDQYILGASTLAASTAIPLRVQNLGAAQSFRVDDETADTTPFVIDAGGNLGVGTATIGAKAQINADASGKGLIVRANATTPGNLQEWQNSGGTAVRYINSAGSLYTPSWDSSFWIGSSGSIALGQDNTHVRIASNPGANLMLASGNDVPALILSPGTGIAQFHTDIFTVKGYSNAPGDLLVVTNSGTASTSTMTFTGKQALGGTTISDGSGGGGQALRLDVTGAVGATHYCDADGLNCFVPGGGILTPALSAITAAVADNTIANAAWNQNWNWQLTAAETGFNYGETAASTGGSNDQYILGASTLATSTAIPLRVQNLGAAQSFRVDDETADTTPFVIAADGNISTGGNVSIPQASYVGVSINSGIYFNTSPNNILFSLDGNTLANFVNGSSNGGAITFTGRPVNPTSGTTSLLTLNPSVNPTSGTLIHSTVNVAPTINQTGGANGVTRGIYINPTLTAAASWRALDISSNSGYGIYQSGASANNYFAGNVGIGTAAPADKLHVTSGTQTSMTLGATDNINGSSVISFRDETSGNWKWWTGVMSDSYGTTSLQNAFVLYQDKNKSEVDVDLFRLVVDNAGNVGIGTTSPAAELDIAGTGAVALARGTTGQRPGTPVNGMIRYNSDNGKFEAYQAGAWQDILTSGGGAATPKLSSIIAADANNTIANAAWNQNWNWQLTAAETGFNYGETAASTGGSNDQYILGASTLAASTAIPLRVQNLGAAQSFRVDDEAADTTPFVIDASGAVSVGSGSITSPGAGTNSEQFGLNATAPGNNSTAVGNNATTTGTEQIAIGRSASATYAGAGYSLVIGNSAVTTAQSATLVGHESTGGGSSVAVGYSADASFQSVAIGNGAAATGGGQVAIGNGASATHGGNGYSVVIGDQASTTGQLTVVIGQGSSAAGGAVAVGGASKAGSNSVAVGVSALGANTTGSDNVAVGAGALDSNTTGYINTAVGRSALGANTTGNENTAVGSNALGANSTATANTAFGANSLSANTTGEKNLAFGPYALNANSTGNDNIAIGYGSSSANNASNNTAIGYFSLNSATAADNNVALGYRAGDSLTTGQNNILIGYDVDAPTATTDEYLNIGGILFGDIGTTSTDPKIGAYKYCDENLANCFVATDVGGSGSVSLSGIAAATVDTLGVNHGAYQTEWEWALGGSGYGLSFTESAASTGGSNDQYLLNIGTVASSTAMPLRIQNLGAAQSFRVDDETADTTPFIIDAAGNLGLGVDPTAKLDVFGGTGNGRLKLDVSGPNPNLNLIGDSSNGYYPSLSLQSAAGGNTSLTGYINNLLISGGTLGASGAISNFLYTTGTSSIYDAYFLELQSNGTVGDGFGMGTVFSLHSDDGSRRNASRIATYWTDATDATRTSNLGFSTALNGTLTERVTIQGNGNVGIGATAPGAKLQVDASASGVGVIVKGNVTTPGNLQEWQNSSAANMAYLTPAGHLWSNSGVTIFNGTNNYGVNLTNDGGNGLTITNGGYGGTLSIDPSAGNARVEVNSSGYPIWIRKPVSVHGETLSVQASYGGADVFYADAAGDGYFAGDVGIGTNSPLDKLYVLANNGQTGITIRQSTNGGANEPTLSLLHSTVGYGARMGAIDNDGSFHIDVQNAGVWTNNALMIRSATGSVGMGDSSPDGTLKLDVEGQVGATEYCDQNGANCFDYTDVTGGGGSVILSDIVAADADNTISSGNFNQFWQWQLAGAESGFKFGESTASAGGSGDQYILEAATLASSTAIPLRVQNLGAAQSFRVDDETADTTPFVIDAGGDVSVGANIYVANGNFIGGTNSALLFNTSPNNMEFQIDGNTLLNMGNGGGYGGWFYMTGRDVNDTSGNNGLMGLNPTVNPTSGTMTHETLAVNPVINQTGGANGITRGIHINPTLTAAANWRALEITNNSGFGIYQSGASATNYFAGDVGIGDATPDGTLLLDVEGQIGATEYCDQNGANCFDYTDVTGGGGSVILSDITAATATNSIDNGTYSQRWRWALSAPGYGMRFTESAAATGGGANDQFLVDIVAGAASTAIPLHITNQGAASSFRVDDETADTTPFVIDASGNVGIKNSNGSAVPLRVNGAGDTFTAVFDTNNGEYVYIGSPANSGGLFSHIDGSIASYDPGSLIYNYADTVYVDQTNGNVGIGSATPSATLHVTDPGNDTYIDIQAGAGGGYNSTISFLSGTGTLMSDILVQDGGSFFLRARNTLDMRLGDNNNPDIVKIGGDQVGIGDTSPDGTLMLDVEGQVGATEYCDQNGANCFDYTDVGGGGGGALSAITAATGANSINNSTNAQVWNWALTGSGAGFTFGENTAATGGSSNQYILQASALASSTATPLYVQNLGATHSFRVDDETSDTSPFLVNQDGNVGIGMANPTTKLAVTGTSNFASAATTTGNAHAFSASGVTTGRVMALSGGGSMTTGNILRLDGASYNPGAGNTGHGVNLQVQNSSGNTSGTSTVSGMNIGMTQFSIGSGGTMDTYGLKIQDLQGSGFAGTQNNYGIRIGNYGLSGNELTYGLYVDPQTGSTANYAAYFGGRVGIGTATPSWLLSLSNGASSGVLSAYSTSTGALAAIGAVGDSSGNTLYMGADYMEVYDNIGGSANGTLRLFPNGAGMVQIGGAGGAAMLSFKEPSGSGTNYTAFKAQAQGADITYTLPSAVAAVNGYQLTSDTSGNLSWAAAGSSVAMNQITAATATNTINNVSYAQEWQWNSLAGASALKLSSTSTAAASGAQKMLEIALSGANATAFQSTYGAYITNTHTGSGSNNVGLYVSSSGGSANRAIVVPDGGGSVGIGTVTPSYLLHVENAASAPIAYIKNTDTSNNDEGLVVETTASSGGQPNTKFTLLAKSGGANRFGVDTAGVTRAYNGLDVDSSNITVSTNRITLVNSGNNSLPEFRMTNGVASNSFNIVNNGYWWLGTQSNTPMRFGANADTDSLVIDTNGKVGIGVTSPAVELDVLGSGQFYGGSVNVYPSGSPGMFLGSAGVYNPAEHGLYGANGTEVIAVFDILGSMYYYGNGNLAVDTSGNVGIQNAAPNVALDVTGDIEYTGTIADVSDMRLKTDIKPLDSADVVARLDQVKTYTFRMKDDEKRRIEMGVMAQELEQVFPELVMTANDEMGTKSVNYIGLISPLVEASKSLKAENDNLKSQIEKLRGDQVAMNDNFKTLAQDIQGLKAHTNYGIDKAQMGLLLLAGALGGGAVAYAGRRRSKK